MRVLAALLIVFAPAAFGQDDGMPVGSSPDGVYFSAVDVAPELVGGLAGLQERLVYPETAREEGVEGLVVVEFVILEDGSLSGIDVLDSPDDRLTEAAVEAARASRFRAGTVGGERVPVRFALPVLFRLSGDVRSGE
ncbi:energy transducer TonB [Rubrivirga sp.]|uniref:energy transducer TonB n=1 Tax=Rubrivirga sp. TaxID=1885344 RepID=UPI003C754C40